MISDQSPALEKSGYNGSQITDGSDVEGFNFSVQSETEYKTLNAQVHRISPGILAGVFLVAIIILTGLCGAFYGFKRHTQKQGLDYEMRNDKGAHGSLASLSKRSPQMDSIGSQYSSDSSYHQTDASASGSSDEESDTGFPSPEQVESGEGKRCETGTNNDIGIIPHRIKEGALKPPSSAAFPPRDPVIRNEDDETCLTGQSSRSGRNPTKPLAKSASFENYQKAQTILRKDMLYSASNENPQAGHAINRYLTCEAVSPTIARQITTKLQSELALQDDVESEI